MAEQSDRPALALQSFAVTSPVAPDPAMTPPSFLMQADAALPFRQSMSDSVRMHLAEQRLGMASQLVLDRLSDRIASDDDDELQAARLLLQHLVHVVRQQEPLAHLGCAPLRPDDRLYQCFADFVELLHRQDRQIRELLAMVAELT